MRTLTAYNEDNFRQIEQYKGISVVRFSAPRVRPVRPAKKCSVSLQTGSIEIFRWGKSM